MHFTSKVKLQLRTFYITSKIITSKSCVISQVILSEQLTRSDFGVSAGLINQHYWEWSKWYSVNVERSNAGD
jgi:hypothetical protein